MYTIQENVRIVVSLLKEYNIRQIVLSPGGTNIPIVQAVQDDPFFKCYSVVDERSAMYFAIGLHLQTGEVIATSCTSAQATRNYVPGLTEAFYKHVPIIAITTSKLARYSYQQYMQAPDQTSLPTDAVKKSYDLPPVSDDDTRAECCKLAKEGILESMHGNPGPVQINLRISDNQNSKFEEINLPVIRKVNRYMAWEDWNDINLMSKKVLVVVGEHRPFSEEQQKALDRFTELYNCVVYTNHLSNYHGKYSLNGNLLVSSGGMRHNELKPDILITIGGQTGDYSIFSSLNNCLEKAEHWRVCTDGALVDTYCHLTKIFECTSYYFFNRLNQVSVPSSSHEYYSSWVQLEKKMNRKVEVPFSNLYVAQSLSEIIPEESIMNFAILNSLRCWSYFNLPPKVQGYANVGAFGIDGCNSMLIGESINTDQLCFLITGDLAFFYDMNALGIRHIKNNLRILVVNNKEGAEFGLMTKNWPYKHDIHPFTSAKGHYGTAKGWAEECGFTYLCASTKNEFESNKVNFVSPSEKPVLLEVFTNSNEEVEAWTTFLSANSLETTSDKAKHTIKKIIGNKGADLVKKIVRH